MAEVTKKAYNIGDVLPDGWVVGPVSPDTGIVMAIEPVSGILEGDSTWYQGDDHAAALRSKGQTNARQPSTNELNAIYNDVVKAGRNSAAQFDVSPLNYDSPFGLYWSSTTAPNPDQAYAQVQYFSDGLRVWGFKEYANARVRCVRDEPGLTLK